MKNTFTLPTLPYVVFELVKVNIDSYQNKNYRAEQVNVIFLAVLPENINWRYISRDAVTKTDNTVFINKISWAPIRTSIRGTFGYKRRLIDGAYLSGWERLQQFQKQIVELSKESAQPNDTERYIYGLNYYNFQTSQFGSINLNSFDVRADARENTSLYRYALDFIIIGDLIKAENKDPLLLSIGYIFAPSGLIDDAINAVNELIGDDKLSTILALPSVPGELLGSSLSTAVGLVNGSKDFLTGYFNSTKQIYTNVSSIF